MIKQEPKWLERSFTITFLILYTGGPLAVILSGGASEGIRGSGEIPDYTLLRYIYLLTYIIAFLLLIPNYKRALYVLSKTKVIALLIVLVFVSSLWSSIPNITISRSFSMAGTTLLGLYLATRYSLRQQLRLLAWALGIAIVLSIIFALALPKYGIESGVHAGAWRGIYTHKNTFGSVMLLSIIVFLNLSMEIIRRKIVVWCFIFLSISLLVLSSASSPLINLLALIAAFFIFRVVHWRSRLAIPVFLFSVVVYGSLSLWLTVSAADIASAFGKDLTLTGRTDIWVYILEMINQRPLLGYGFDSFWLSDSANVIRQAIGWKGVPNAHNGYLDLALALGITGALIFTAGYVLFLLRGIAYLRVLRTPDGIWALMYLTYFSLINFTESSLLGRNSIVWLIYVSTSFSLPLLSTYYKQVGDGQSVISNELHRGISKVIKIKSTEILP